MKKKDEISDGTIPKKSKWDQRSFNTIWQAVVMTQIMERVSLRGGSLDDLSCEIDAIDDFDDNGERRIWRKSLNLLDKWQIIELFRSNYTDGVDMPDGWAEKMQRRRRSLPSSVPKDRGPLPSTKSVDPDFPLALWLLNQFPQSKISRKRRYRAVDQEITSSPC